MFVNFSKFFGKESELTKSQPSEQYDAANEIVDTSFYCARRFHENASKVGNQEQNMGIVVNEIIFLFLHIINRMAYSRGGKKAQEKIYNEIANGVVKNIVAKINTVEYSAFLDVFAAGIIETEKAYAECSGLVAAENESWSNTILWKAAKRVSQSEDIADIMFAIEVLMAALEVLKLEAKVREYRI